MTIAITKIILFRTSNQIKKGRGMLYKECIYTIETIKIRITNISISL